ncbi:MAG: methylaspartate mutase accessory protein GlmL [Bacilli bacterium]|nr:methylaspartate mutase accessory protein GlmL [Bacilli bacterium]MDD4388265.1 methylaspartate mutase accessory protein GlmL [Bacilli bacterium]
MSNYLLVDIGSTYTKLTAVDLNKCDIVGSSRHFTTVDTDVRRGYEKAFMLLAEKTNITEYEKIYACSSAAGGLKMAAIGLVEELTVEAAKRVCLGAGGKVSLVYSHYLTQKDAESIRDGAIDIILLAGGTDGGNQECVIHNAAMLGKIGIQIPVVYAGNRSCQDQIQTIFKEYKIRGWICDNVMPRLNVLNIESARQVIQTIFMNNITAAKGIKKIEEEIDGGVLPTPYAVLKAAELLSRGYLHEAGLGDIIVIDIGGATTDFYSICSGMPKQANVLVHGLEEPFAKRTVEGDLGMRYSAAGVLKNLSEEQIKLYREKGIDLRQEANYRNANIDFLPKNEREEYIDSVLARLCADIATSRHVGTFSTVYTPLGVMYYQTGKDLSDVKFIIGTGGVIIYDRRAYDILKTTLRTPQKPMELRPRNPDFLLDYDYLTSAMGLLSMYHPEVALKIMKKRIKKIERAYYES